MAGVRGMVPLTREVVLARLQRLDGVELSEIYGGGTERARLRQQRCRARRWLATHGHRAVQRPVAKMKLVVWPDPPTCKHGHAEGWYGSGKQRKCKTCARLQRRARRERRRQAQAPEGTGR